VTTEISRCQAQEKEKSLLEQGNPATWVKNGVHKHIEIYSEQTNIFWLKNCLSCSSSEVGRAA